MEIDVFLYWLL